MLSIAQEPVTKDFIDKKKSQIKKKTKTCNKVHITVLCGIPILFFGFWFAAILSAPVPLAYDAEEGRRFALMLTFLCMIGLEFFIGGFWKDNIEANNSELNSWDFVEKKNCETILNLAERRLEIRNYLNKIVAMDRLPLNIEFDTLLDFDHTYETKKREAAEKAVEEASAEKACALLLAGEF